MYFKKFDFLYIKQHVFPKVLRRKQILNVSCSKIFLINLLRFTPASAYGITIQLLVSFKNIKNVFMKA